MGSPDFDVLACPRSSRVGGAGVRRPLDLPLGVGRGGFFGSPPAVRFVALAAGRGREWQWKAISGWSLGSPSCQEAWNHLGTICQHLQDQYPLVN